MHFYLLVNSNISPWSWIIAILFVAHQLLQYILHLPIPYVDSYFDPFACAVIGLTVFQWERVHLWRSQQRQLSLTEIVMVTAVLALISEEVFPRLSNEFYRDSWDYAALTLGGAYFYLFINSFNKSPI